VSTSDYDVLDVEGYDRRFATVEGPHEIFEVGRWLVDREVLAVYPFALTDRGWLHTETVRQIVDRGYRFGEIHGEIREAVLRAVEEHDLPRELKEAVPFEPRLTLREQLVAVLRDLAQRLRGHAERVRS
jgi:hypothetical protein